MKPIIYEINTATFLYDLGETLGTVPDKVWDDIAAMHINTVWLMGVWRRSPRSVAMATGQPWVEAALPGATDDDVIGSAYSIRSYTVDQRFGGNEGLAIARAKLKKRGIKLWLDYVPNHVAIDHPWTIDHPDYFIQGTQQELDDNPDAFKKVGEHIYANGKDPNYEPWSDVLQLNAFSSTLRAATLSTLKSIADMCDGVRCDMAMLTMNDIFTKTWGERAGKVPKTDFWPNIIHRVKSTHPGFLFTAEVYWDRETALVHQGFDYCYDKALYDALIEGSSSLLRERLAKTIHIESNLLHFIENHDEPRAAGMPWQQHQAAAVIMSTLPGAHLYYEGQWEGRIRHVPVQLRRHLEEPRSDVIYEFYSRLLAMNLAGFWRTLSVHKNPDVFAWQRGDRTIIVNFGPHKQKIILGVKTGLIELGEAKVSGRTIMLEPYGFVVMSR